MEGEEKEGSPRKIKKKGRKESSKQGKGTSLRQQPSGSGAFLVSPIKPRQTRSRKREDVASPAKASYCVVRYNEDGILEKSACEGRVVGEMTEKKYRGTGPKLPCQVVFTGGGKACSEFIVNQEHAVEARRASLFMEDKDELDTQTPSAKGTGTAAFAPDSEHGAPTSDKIVIDDGEKGLENAEQHNAASVDGSVPVDSAVAVLQQVDEDPQPGSARCNAVASEISVDDTHIVISTLQVEGEAQPAFARPDCEHGAPTSDKIVIDDGEKGLENAEQHNAASVDGSVPVDSAVAVLQQVDEDPQPGSARCNAVASEISVDDTHIVISTLQVEGEAQPAFARPDCEHGAPTSDKIVIDDGENKGLENAEQHNAASVDGSVPVDSAVAVLQQVDEDPQPGSARCNAVASEISVDDTHIVISTLQVEGEAQPAFARPDSEHSARTSDKFLIDDGEKKGLENAEHNPASVDGSVPVDSAVDVLQQVDDDPQPGSPRCNAVVSEISVDDTHIVSTLGVEGEAQPAFARPDSEHSARTSDKFLIDDGEKKGLENAEHNPASVDGSVPVDSAVDVLQQVDDDPKPSYNVSAQDHLQAMPHEVYVVEISADGEPIDGVLDAGGDPLQDVDQSLLSSPVERFPNLNVEENESGGTFVKTDELNIMEVNLDGNNQFTIPLNSPSEYDVCVVSDMPPEKLLESDTDTEEDIFMDYDPPAPVSLPFVVKMGPPKDHLVIRQIVFDRPESFLRRLYVVHYVNDTKTMHISTGSDAAKYVDHVPEMREQQIQRGDCMEADEFCFGLQQKPFPCRAGKLGELLICDQLRPILLRLSEKFLRDYITAEPQVEQPKTLILEDTASCEEPCDNQYVRISEDSDDGDNGQHDPDYDANAEDIDSSEDSEAHAASITEIIEVPESPATISSHPLQRSSPASPLAIDLTKESPGPINSEKSSDATEAQPNHQPDEQSAETDNGSEDKLKKTKKAKSRKRKRKRKKRSSRKLKKRKRRREREKRKKKEMKKKKKKKAAKRAKYETSSEDEDDSSDDSSSMESSSSSDSSSSSSESSSSSGNHESKSGKDERRDHQKSKDSSGGKKSVDKFASSRDTQRQSKKDRKSDTKEKDDDAKDTKSPHKAMCELMLLLTGNISNKVDLTKKDDESAKEFRNRLRRARRKEKKKDKDWDVIYDLVKAIFPLEFYLHVSQKKDLFAYDGPVVIVDEAVAIIYGQLTPSGFCIVCKKVFRKAADHLRTAHKEDACVVALHENGKDKADPIEHLIRRANYTCNNKTVLATCRGVLMPMRRSPLFRQPNKMLTCQYCYGLIDRTHRDRHFRNCDFADDAIQYCSSVTANIPIVASINQSDRQSMEEYLRCVLSKLKDEARRNFCLNDALVWQFLLTSSYSKPRSVQLEKNLKAYAHLLARFWTPLLKELQLCSTVDAMSVERGARLHHALLELGNIHKFYEDTDKYIMDLRRCASGRTCSQYSRTLSPILKTMAVLARQQIGARFGFRSEKCMQCKELIRYMQNDTLWDGPLQKALSLQRTLGSMHIDPAVSLPKDEDVDLLVSDTREQMKVYGSVLKNPKKIHASQRDKLYDCLVDSVILFLLYWSRNRKTETSSITKLAYSEASTEEPLHKDKNSHAMATLTKDVFVLGKGNQRVPINIPHFLFGAIDLILMLHVPLGLQDNRFVFAKRSTNSFRDCTNYFRKRVKILGLESAQKLLGSQGARRAGATSMMCMTLADAKQVDQVDKRFGHNRSTSEKAYEKKLSRVTTELGGSVVLSAFYNKPDQLAGQDAANVDIATPLAAEVDAITGLPVTAPLVASQGRGESSTPTSPIPKTASKTNRKKNRGSNRTSTVTATKATAAARKRTSTTPATVPMPKRPKLDVTATSVKKAVKRASEGRGTPLVAVMAAPQGPAPKVAKNTKRQATPVELPHALGVRNQQSAHGDDALFTPDAVLRRVPQVSQSATKAKPPLPKSSQQTTSGTSSGGQQAVESSSGAGRGRRGGKGLFKKKRR